MGQFRIKIAGRVAQIHSLFDSTKHYCTVYLTGEPAQIQIIVTQADLAAEQKALREEAHRDGIRPRVFSEPFLERSFIQRKLAEALLPYGVLLLHGSAVAVDGQGYLFTAGCGTGKSTHTRLWRQAFGDRAVMVNDDKPFLRIEKAGVFLCGSPWSGKHGLDTNIIVPLKGICVLEQGEENRIWPVSPEAVLPMLKKQSAHPGSPLVESLSQQVPLWRMTCTKAVQAAQISYEAMK